MARNARIATLKDPTILAAVRGYFRYATPELALEMLQKIGQDFRCFRLKPTDTPPCDSLEKTDAYSFVLWVLGYGVSRKQRNLGYRGHVARLSVASLEGGIWTIHAQKLDVPLAAHPKPKPPPPQHPNWRHPVLQLVQKGKKIPTITEAQALLQSLHLAYPKATIPGKDVLRVMVYCRGDGTVDPIQRVMIKVKPLSGGGAKLVLLTPAAKSAEAALEESSDDPNEVSGSFTSMVAKRRRRRKAL